MSGVYGYDFEWVRLLPQIIICSAFLLIAPFLFGVLVKFSILGKKLDASEGEIDFDWRKSLNEAAFCGMIVCCVLIPSLVAIGIWDIDLAVCLIASIWAGLQLANVFLFFRFLGFVKKRRRVAFSGDLPMSEQFDDIPGWVFDVDEVSAGVYFVKASSALGQSFSLKGVNVDEMIRACKDKISSELS